MHPLIRILMFVALAWSAYWYIAGYGLRNAITGWFDHQLELGWQADFSDVVTRGYPLQHITILENPTLADPVNGTAWSADWIKLESPAIWPGRQMLSFASTPQRLSYFDQTTTVQAESLQADLHLQPGVALALERMALSAGRWLLSSQDDPQAGGQSLSLILAHSGVPESYSITLEVNSFTPSEELRRLMRSAPGLPQSFETLELDALVVFDKPWDRSALEQRRPQPIAIDLQLAEVTWGELRLFATGELEVDDQGIPTGEIAVKAENWRNMVEMANAAGALPDQAVDLVTRVLEFMAGLSGNPTALDLHLSFRDGFVALGPLPLGPAPRLILH